MTAVEPEFSSANLKDLRAIGDLRGLAEMQLIPSSRLAQRAILLVFAAILIVVGLSSIMLMVVQARDAISGRRTSIEALALVYASAVADAVDAGDRKAMFTVLRSISRLPQVHYVTVADASGRRLASLGSDTSLNETWYENNWEMALTGEYIVPVEIMKAGRRIGMLMVAVDVSDLRHHLLNSMLLTLGVLMSGGIVSLWIGVMLQHKVTAPMLSVIKAIGDVRARGDCSTNVSFPADHEAGDLVASFNAMMQDIRSRDEELRKLAYADPMTGLANRKLFHEELQACVERCIRSGQSAALFLFDLDGCSVSWKLEHSEVEFSAVVSLAGRSGER